MTHRCYLLAIIAFFLLLCPKAGTAYCGHFSQENVQSDSHAAMIAESVLYLQKAISHFEADSDLQDVDIRLAPIVTVMTGLLDAGVASDEPLLQSGLRFLQQFYDDQKSWGCNATVSENLLVQIEACLEKVRQSTLHDAVRQRDTSEDKAFLLNALAAIEDSDAVARAVAFVRQLDEMGANDTESDAAMIIVDETYYVVAPGWGHSIRFCDLNQALDALVMRPSVDLFSAAQWDCLIASVHGLRDYPARPDEPWLPKHEPLFATVSQPARSSDSRKKSTDQQVSACWIASYCSFLNAFEPQQSVVRKHLLADNLAALQTVRRLE